MFHNRNGQKDTKYAKNDTILKSGKNGHFAKAIVHLGEMVKNGLFLGSTLKIENHTENDCRHLLHILLKEKARKNIKYVKDDTILKSGKNDLVLASTLKIKNHAKNDSRHL